MVCVDIDGASLPQKKLKGKTWKHSSVEEEDQKEV